MSNLTDLIQKKVFISNPVEEHFALKGAEGVVTSVNVETKRCMIKVKQPDGSKTFLWFNPEEFEQEGTTNTKIVPDAEDIEPVIEVATEVVSTDMIEPAEKMKTDDPVNHPSHYTDGKYEVIDFIEALGLDTDFRVANAVKYISRAGKKTGADIKQDYEKALWYLKRFCDSTGRKKDSYVPQVGHVRMKNIDIEDYIKDKGLWNTLPGFALEAIVYGSIAVGIHILEAYINTL